MNRKPIAVSTIGALVLVLATLIPVAAEAACSTTAKAHCLQGNRFRVEVQWSGFGSDGGSARTVAGGTADSGLFYFFGPNNWELMVKVLDACGTANGANNRFWVFAAAATTLHYTLKVTDTQTGAIRQYSNPLGQSSPAITDTNAFATCGGQPGPTPTPVSGASQVRYRNDVYCNDPVPFSSFTSTLSANGHAWQSTSGSFSGYQAVHATKLGPFTETNDSVCIDANYPQTYDLVPGQAYRLVQGTGGGGRFLTLTNEGPAGQEAPLEEETSLPGDCLPEP